MNELWPWLVLILLGAYHGINPGMGWLFAVALGMQEQRRAAVLSSLVPITLGHALSVGAVVAAVLLLERQLPQAPLRYGAAAVLIAFGLYKLIRARHPRFGGMQARWRDLTVWSFLMASAHGAGLMLVPVLLGMSAAGSAETPMPHGTGAADAHPPSTSMSQGADRAEPMSAAQASLEHGTMAADGEARRENADGANHGSEHGDGHAEHGTALAEAARGSVVLGLLAVVVHTLAYLIVMAGIAIVVYEKVGLALLRSAWWNLDLLWALVLIATGVITLFL